MARKRLEFPEGIVECLEATRGDGTILCATHGPESNGMTIGWITIGQAWGRPCCVVLVRPSRHTFTIMEKADTFTVNVLSPKYGDAINLFGTASGRDMNKFEKAGLTPVRGEVVESVYIKQADLVIECKTSFKQPMNKNLISADYVKECYEDGDYHTLYYGEIMAIHRK